MDEPDEAGAEDVERAKAVLRRLAGTDHRVVERAEAAVADLEAAVEVVEAVGVDELARAVEAAEDPDRRRRGERALAAFRRFRAAAAGGDGTDGRGDHFHPGRDTDLRRGDEATAE